MTVTRRTIAVMVLAMLLIAALVVTALQSPQNGTDTVAVVADAKAKTA